jgi:hypothetical protein
MELSCAAESAKINPFNRGSHFIPRGILGVNSSDLLGVRRSVLVELLRNQLCLLEEEMPACDLIRRAIV